MRSDLLDTIADTLGSEIPENKLSDDELAKVAQKVTDVVMKFMKEYFSD